MANPKDYAEAARQGLALAELTDDEYAAPILFFLEHYVRRHGIDTDPKVLAARAQALRAGLVRVENAHRVS